MAKSHETASPQRWKPIALVGGVLFLLGLARYLGLDVYLKNLEPWIQSFGPLGPLVFVGLYVLAAIAAIPGSALTLVAGVLFGSFWGVVWVSVASTLAAAVCFLIARYFAREAMEQSFKDNAQFQKLARLTAAQGVFIVAILRLLPIFPFNLLNYGFGLTRVSFLTYIFWSWLCMLPGTVLYVVGADALKQGLAQGRVPWALVCVVLGALCILSVIGVWARKHVKALD